MARVSNICTRDTACENENQSSDNFVSGIISIIYCYQSLLFIYFFLAF